VGFESNLGTNAERKAQTYRDLVLQQSDKHTNVKFINLSMSALGILDKCTSEFFDMLTDLQFDTATKNYILRKITTIAVRTSTTSSAEEAKSGQILNSYLINTL